MSGLIGAQVQDRAVELTREGVADTSPRFPFFSKSVFFRTFDGDLRGSRRRINFYGNNPAIAQRRKGDAVSSRAGPRVLPARAARALFTNSANCCGLARWSMSFHSFARSARTPSAVVAEDVGDCRAALCACR